jgi:hypothetical protein
MDLIPATPILPPKRTPRKELCCPCRIPTQKERRREGETYGRYHYETLYAKWCDADFKNGDLLYVGSTLQLMTRLHPHSHFMWSVVWRRPVRKRVRIAVWAMPCEHLNDVESWMTHSFAPLWSNAYTRDAHEWVLRPPDLVLPTDAFYPYRRSVLPFDTSTAGVYAWLLAPENVQSDAWVETVLQNADRRREIKSARPPRRVPPAWSCGNCWVRFNHYSRKTCECCGIDRETSNRIGSRKLREALSKAGI